ncbi:MAG: GntR family transcriptional regulator [Actinomycetota bacterium]|nr:GntR family transcriptional regulator [Actinomycetota bacterium]
MTDGTKADELAVELEEEIVSGEIAPGSVLRQDQLSARFGVSRTPVREALGRLTALGLVSFEANRGARVRTLAHDALYEAFLVRAELESLATELAATKRTDADIAELDAANARFADATERLADASEDDRWDLTSAWVRGNHAFHDVIYRIAAAPMVERIAKSARRTFSGSAVWNAGSLDVSELFELNVRQHRAISEAVAAGSGAGARALAREHVLSSFHLLETVLRESREGVGELRRSASAGGRRTGG